MNETGVQSNSNSHENSLSRLNHAMGPVLAGMIIDLVDLITFGPVGLVLGVPVGGIAGYWLGHSMRLDRNACLLCALAAGIYCTIPFTELLPLGTIVGALVRYEDYGRSHSPTVSQAADENRAENPDEAA